MSRLRGIARFEFHDGKVEEFKRMSQQCMEIVRAKEPGTTQYDIYFDEAESSCVVYEKYENSEALITHFGNVGELMAPIMETATVTVELLGNPSEELRALLTGDQPRLMTPYLSLQGH